MSRATFIMNVVEEGSDQEVPVRRRGETIDEVLTRAYPSVVAALGDEDVAHDALERVLRRLLAGATIRDVVVYAVVIGRRLRARARATARQVASDDLEIATRAFVTADDGDPTGDLPQGWMIQHLEHRLATGASPVAVAVDVLTSLLDDEIEADPAGVIRGLGWLLHEALVIRDGVGRPPGGRDGARARDRARHQRDTAWPSALATLLARLSPGLRGGVVGREVTFRLAEALSEADRRRRRDRERRSPHIVRRHDAVSEAAAETATSAITWGEPGRPPHRGGPSDEPTG
ncbi:MAG TPA: hypothetical protein VGO60_09610 [Iamia sp.]|nr:hypothetical protein [Iamia sp.]